MVRLLHWVQKVTCLCVARRSRPMAASMELHECDAKNVTTSMCVVNKDEGMNHCLLCSQPTFYFKIDLVLISHYLVRLYLHGLVSWARSSAGVSAALHVATASHSLLYPSEKSTPVACPQIPWESEQPKFFWQGCAGRGRWSAEWY
jgi:hypothetical protein